MFIPNTEKVKLFGMDLVLSERTAWDVNKLIQFSKDNKEKDYEYYTIESAILVSDALKNNYQNLKWYEFFKKRKLSRLLSKENISKSMSSRELFWLAKKVYKLEGVEDSKKKVTAKESVETLQSV